MTPTEQGRRDSDITRERFEEPTLTYVKPEVKELGRVEELTATAFFGTFSP